MFTAFNLRCLVHSIFLHVTSWIPCLRSFFCMKPLHVLIHTRFLPTATSRSCSATFFVFDRFVRCLVHVPCFLSAAALPLIQATFCHMRSLHGPAYAPFSWLRPLHGIVHIHSARKGTYLFCETKNNIVKTLFFLNSDAIRFSFLFFTQ